MDLKDVKARNVLRTLLSPYSLDYVAIGDTIIVTTEDMAMTRQLRQRISVDMDKVDFAAALKQISRETAANLILDRAEKQAQTKVTLRLEDVPLETAVRLLAEMAGLKPVRVGNVLFITGKDNAKEMMQDPDIAQPNPAVRADSCSSSSSCRSSSAPRTTSAAWAAPRDRPPSRRSRCPTCRRPSIRRRRNQTTSPRPTPSRAMTSRRIRNSTVGRLPTLVQPSFPNSCLGDRLRNSVSRPVPRPDAKRSSRAGILCSSLGAGYEVEQVKPSLGIRAGSLSPSCPLVQRVFLRDERPHPLLRPIPLRRLGAPAARRRRLISSADRFRLCRKAAWSRPARYSGCRGGGRK